MALIPRQPHHADLRLAAVDSGPTRSVPWRERLTNGEQTFLTDNQLSAWLAQDRPGCMRTLFYPLPFPHEFAKKRWDFDEVILHDHLQGEGPTLEVAVEQRELRFSPYRIERTMAGQGVTIREQSAISGNTLLMSWDIEGLDILGMYFRLPMFRGAVQWSNRNLLVDIDGQLFVCLSFAGAANIQPIVQGAPVSARINVAPTSGEPLIVAASYGYDRQGTIEAARTAASDPAALFAAAEATWDEYFRRVVPPFTCSDKKLERLYYYQAYVTRADLVDVPYEPFTHPYTCLWKAGAVWQWTWNTGMNAIAERWLNDKGIGAGGLLLERDNGGGLNVGSYLHPLRKVTELRDYAEQMEALAEARHQLPSDFDPLPYTTIPHTTPSGLLGAWLFFLNTGDRRFLRDMLGMMLEAEAEFSRNELPQGLYTTVFVDEFDYSLRLAPFIEEVKGEDGEEGAMLQTGTPFVAVDYNCYLHALREVIIQAATLLRDERVDVAALRARNARLAEAINRYLWDAEYGFYYDADPETLELSGIKSIAGFAPLYAGLASESQAARLVEHLTNPDEFGTPYPCPSVSMDTPEVDPSIATYGGDVLIASGIWFTVEGLVRYGYRDLAADYIVRALRMVMQGGPSSAYSYNSRTGEPNQERHTLASQSTLLTDLLCRYVIGLQPQLHGALRVDPLALEQSGVDAFEFGPYLNGGDWITVRYVRGQGYTLERRPAQ